MREIFKSFAIAVALIAPMALQAAEKPANVKTGWNFGPLPAVSFSTDMGFQYGALCDIFYYGDGSTYPKYKHKFNVELSRYTKGTSTMHLFYDSEYLIPNVRVTADVTYRPETMYQFWGFNGVALPSLEDDPTNPAHYFNMHRNSFRALADFQGKIGDLPLGWVAGAAYRRFNVMDVKDAEGNPDGNTLYRFYNDAGYIDSDEMNGGSHLEFKAGLFSDTRNSEAAPDHGYRAELYAVGSPDLFGTNKSYLQLVAHFRHYLPLASDKLVFAYHLGYQGLLAGELPFYSLSNIHTLYLRQISSEGLGSINTVRGTLRNRILADGYAWSNLEMRIRLFQFDFIKQHWYVATNPFFDMGVVTKAHKADLFKEVKGISSLHSSAGAGIKIVMNYNFIISCEVGKPLRSIDGNFGMAIGLNYIF